TTRAYRHLHPLLSPARRLPSVAPPPLPHLLILFFCKAYVPPRRLHSFPTRRSSDLPADRAFTIVPARDLRGSNAVICTPAAAVRSEEHTSELQSHLNIVCRLLLEKKKNT